MDCPDVPINDCSVKTGPLAWSSASQMLIDSLTLVILSQYTYKLEHSVEMHLAFTPGLTETSHYFWFALTGRKKAVRPKNSTTHTVHGNILTHTHIYSLHSHPTAAALPSCCHSNAALASMSHWQHMLPLKKNRKKNPIQQQGARTHSHIPSSAVWKHTQLKTRTWCRLIAHIIQGEPSLASAERWWAVVVNSGNKKR